MPHFPDLQFMDSETRIITQLRALHSTARSRGARLKIGSARLTLSAILSRLGSAKLVNLAISAIKAISARLAISAKIIFLDTDVIT